MLQFVRQYWLYLLGAVLLHALFAGIFGLTLLRMARESPPPQLAIQAVVVDSSLLASQPRRPPLPDPARERAAEEQRQREIAEQRRQQEEAARKEQEQRAEQERLAEQKRRETEVQRQQAEERQRREQEEAQRRKEAEAERQRKAEAERKAAEAEKQRKAEAERKRVEEIKRKQEEEARKRRQAEEARAQAAREAELRSQLEAEEQAMAARGSPEMAQYIAMLQQHIERRWVRPPSARRDLECEVKVQQAPGGAVLSAEVGRCNGDSAVRQSIETAVMRASPLPTPSNPRLFERNLVFIFRPTE
jgi:colicin import membrane protein